MPSQPRPRASWREVGETPVGPAGLRVAALTLPVLASVAGYLLPRSRVARTAIRLAALSLPVGAAGVVVAAGDGRVIGPAPTGVPRSATVGKAPPGGDDASETAEAMVTVVIPARDEAAVIARLVADLGAARSDPMALVVVDDASRDGTADLARAAIACSSLTDVARVIRLATPSGSKGAALAAVPVPASGVVVVLDADARVGPDFIARVRMAGSTGATAQARRRMLRPVAGCQPRRGAGLLTLMQDGEQEVDGLIARARLRIGGATEFRGDGMVIRADVLAGLGGWAPDALCEDLELATRWYLASGCGVERPVGLEIWEQPVLSLPPLLGQRLRWAEGSIRRDLRLVLPALLDPRQSIRRRVELAAYAAQALVPWVALGIAARARRGPAEPRRPHGRDHRQAAGQTLVALASGYALAALVLVWGSQPDGAEPADGVERAGAAARAAEAELETSAGRGVARPTPAPSEGRRRTPSFGHWRRLARAATVTAFTGLWALVLPVAWLRVVVQPRSPGFIRTPHEAPARFIEPGSDPRPLT